MLTERSLKCACHSVIWMVTEWWLKCDWDPPYPSPFIRHLATIQSPFSRLKGTRELSSCVCSNEGPRPTFQGEIISKYWKYIDKIKNSSSQESPGQFQSNLIQRILVWRLFKFVQMKGYTFLQWEINKIQQKYFDI